MIIRKPIKLKAYRLSYIYTELQKKKKLNRNYNINLTETKYKNDTSSKKILTKLNIKMNTSSLKHSINSIFSPHKSYETFKSLNDSNKNIFNKKNYLNKNYYVFLPKLKGTKEKKFSLSLFEKEKKKQRDKYKEKLRVKLFELEKCEKKFDVEIYNTLNKLNEEEGKLNNN